MKVIMVEPGRNAQIVEIGNGLEDMQKAVGGYIEAICPFDDDVALVCNEEGKFNGSVKNRVLWYKDLHPELYNPDNAEIFDVIYGSFFVCGAPVDSEKFQSLSDEQIETYFNLFETPDFTYTEDRKIIFNESEKKEMKKFVVNFDYAENNDFAIETAKEIVEYLNNGDYTDIDTAISEELDRKLIYYDDQWKMIQTYQRPHEANYDTALEMFMNELYSIIKEEIEQEIEEELDEQGEER